MLLLSNIIFESCSINYTISYHEQTKYVLRVIRETTYPPSRHGILCIVVYRSRKHVVYTKLDIYVIVLCHYYSGTFNEKKKNCFFWKTLSLKLIALRHHFAYCYHHNCKNTATGIMEGVVRLSAKLVTDMFKGIMSLILVIFFVLIFFTRRTLKT